MFQTKGGLMAEPKKKAPPASGETVLSGGERSRFLVFLGLKPTSVMILKTYCPEGTEQEPIGHRTNYHRQNVAKSLAASTNNLTLEYEKFHKIPRYYRKCTPD